MTSLLPGPPLGSALPFPAALPNPASRAHADRVQLTILGNGGKVRQVLLPDIVSRSPLSLRADAGANHPSFASRKGGHLTERVVNGMVKRTAKRAGINEGCIAALAAPRARLARH